MGAHRFRYSLLSVVDEEKVKRREDIYQKWQVTLFKTGRETERDVKLKPSSSFCISASPSSMYPPKEEFHYNPPPSAPVTGIPVSVPPGTALNVQPPRIGPWSTGLCGCCDDCGNCCITCLCPCITFGQVAEIVDKGSTSCAASGALYALLLYFTGCACIYSCFYRSKLRAQYGLREAPCNDCLVHCCCECCSLCQMYRELKRRGFDMSLGWHANMDRQVTTPIMAPPPQTMNR